jgi:hypothetical protein
MSWRVKGNTGTNAAMNYVGTTDNQPLAIRTNGAEKARLSANGELGIGTASPLFRLHVVAPGNFVGEDANGVSLAGTVPIMAQSDGTAVGILNSQGRPAFALNIDGNQGTINARGVPTLYDRFDGNWHPGISLRNGNVGIGTTTPDARLTVQADGGNGGPGSRAFQLRISGGSNPNNKLEIGYDTVGNFAVIGALTEGVAWRNIVLANNGGNVGIGTTTPQFKLEVRSGLPNQAALVAVGTGMFSALGGVKTAGDGFGVGGEARGAGAGIFGINRFGTGAGVQGQTQNTTTTSIGVVGFIGPDVPPWTPPALAVTGGLGVLGFSPTGSGVGGATSGQGPVGNGVEGFYGGVGAGAAIHGVASVTSAVAVYGYGPLHAAWFIGNVSVQGTITSSGKGFRIDHPLDPANRFLNHSSVESPDMMTIYNGYVVTDDDSRADILLPEYFEALNEDFKYQFTPIQQFAQVMLEREIENNRCVIRTDKPNVRVSWQVTGIRGDRYARMRRIEVEEEKTTAERDRYLHPELYESIRAGDTDAKPLGHLPRLLGSMENVSRPAPNAGELSTVGQVSPTGLSLP